MKLTLALVSTLLILNSCCKKPEPEIVYKAIPCPKLQTYEVPETLYKPFTLDYEVK